MKAFGIAPRTYPPYHPSFRKEGNKRNLGFERVKRFQIPNFATLVIVVAILTACNTSAGDKGRATATATSVPSITEMPSATPTTSATASETPVPSPTADTRISPKRWQEWPIVPSASPEMKKIFQSGVELGNNPSAFSKIGDGEISTVWFLTQYDLGPSNYHLGSYSDLESVIKRFSGSFGHIGMAAGRGFNTTIILGPAPAGTTECQASETRLDCELRTFHPSFVIISLGTNQVWQPEIFKPELQRIIERLLEADVVPILSTKADNLEGDHRINQIIAELAYAYHLPLWNFWLAVQPLPDHGLQTDHEHLTYAYSDFNNPINYKYAWPLRNLTALQVLDSVAKSVTSQP